MAMTRATRFLGLVMIGAGSVLLAGSAAARLNAAPVGQEQPPSRREFDLTAADYRFTPSRLEVKQDELVKVTLRSADVAYSLTIDEYRVSKRVPAGGVVSFELRADKPGTFPFYSNLTSDARHKNMKGDFIVRPK